MNLDKKKFISQKVKEIIEDYINRKDWRVHENSNTDYSFPNLMLHASGWVIAEYTLNEVYKDLPIAEMHRKGQVHIHDLSGGIAPYCAGWSLKQLLDEGFNGVPGKTASNPAKHLRSAVSHMVNFLGVMSNEWMGAQAFSDVDVYLAPYILKDYIDLVDSLVEEGLDKDKAKKIAFKLIKKDLKQSIQELLFNLNFPTRWGGQAPFTNFTLALTVPEDLKNIPATVAAKPVEYRPDIFKIENDKDKSYYTYKDLQDFINLFNKTFFEVYLEGDANGRVFTFPVLTINLTEEFFNLPNDLLDIILEANAKYGATYFQNCINGESGLEKIKPSDVRSMCCRLQLNLNELQKHTGGLFGNGEFVGSIGVVTLNLPEIGYIAKTQTDSMEERKKRFLEILEDWMEKAKDGLLRKREIILKNFEKGLYPYTKRYLLTKFKTHFLTIGYVGLHEAMKNLGYENGLLDEEAHKFSQEILDFMREKTREFQKKYGCLFNLEATPAEGASYRLARLSKKRIPDLITSGTEEAPYFTNSCHPPVWSQNDLVFLTNHQNELQNRHTGGTVVHFYIGEKPNKETLLELLKILGQTKIPYFTFTTVFSVCPIHGYIPGEHPVCPYPHTEEELEKFGVDINELPLEIKKLVEKEV